MVLVQIWQLLGYYGLILKEESKVKSVTDKSIVVYGFL